MPAPRAGLARGAGRGTRLRPALLENRIFSYFQNWIQKNRKKSKKKIEPPKSRNFLVSRSDQTWTPGSCTATRIPIHKIGLKKIEKIEKKKKRKNNYKSPAPGPGASKMHKCAVGLDVAGT